MLFSPQTNTKYATIRLGCQVCLLFLIPAVNSGGKNTYRFIVSSLLKAEAMTYKRKGLFF